jgi:DnaJ-like protein
MVTVIFGVIALALLLMATNAFASADPRKLAPVVKMVGGMGALGGAAFLAARGQLGVAIPLGFAGLGLLGWLPFGPAGIFQRTQKSPGQVSRVRSAFLEMELYHDTGAMRGRILAGQYEGLSLDALDAKTLIGFLGEIDEESRDLLMAYLDRRQPRWREDVQADAATGQTRPARSTGKMTDEEAYQILGVHPGATAEEIGRAHRTLMKKLHPDQGGSTYLAARVNEAKDVLLRRHR